jgi:hypothetical protein
MSRVALQKQRKWTITLSGLMCTTRYFNKPTRIAWGRRDIDKPVIPFTASDAVSPYVTIALTGVCPSE